MVAGKGYVRRVSGRVPYQIEIGPSRALAYVVQSEHAVCALDLACLALLPLQPHHAQEPLYILHIVTYARASGLLRACRGRGLTATRCIW